jgi:hypothetical protein
MADLIRRIRVISSSEGAGATAADINKVAEAIKVVDRAADKRLNITNEFERLRASLSATLRANNEFDKGARVIGRYSSQAGADLAKVAEAMDALTQRFLDRSGATKIMEAELTRAAEMTRMKAEQIGKAFNDGLTQSFGIGGGVKSARDAASVFEAELGRMEEIARLKAMQIGKAFNDGLTQSFGMGAAAKSAREAASVFQTEFDRLDKIAEQKGQQAGRNFADGLQDRLRIGVKATDFGATFSALDEQMRQQEEISRARAAQNASGAQYGINQAFGIGASPSSARASAAVFEEAAKAADMQAAAVARLRAEINPLGAAQDRLNDSLMEYRGLAAAGAISAGELTAAEALAQRNFALTTRTLDGLSRGTRVNTQTMQNMAFQLNDIAVMSASGQNFGVMAMQQGMQLAQGFEQAGVKGTGALKLLGLGVAQFLTNPLYIAVAAIAAAGEGVHLLASAFKSSIPPLNEVLKTHDDLLKSIKEGYSDAANAAVAFSTKSQSALLAMTDRQRVLEEFHLQATGKSLADILTSGTTVVASQQISGVPKELLQIRDAVDLYSASVEKGAPKAAELFESLLKIERTTADQNIKQFAVSILQSIQPVADLEEGLRNLNVAATRASALRVAAQQVDPATLNPDRGTNTLYLERLRQANELNAVSARSPGQLAAVQRSESVFLLSEKG